jgi:mRNA interferase MazF
MTVPQRGEVWLADCGLAAKVRPVLVISVTFKEPDRALIAVIPHTTSLVGSEFEVALPVPWLKPGAFSVQATFPLAPARFIWQLGVLTTDQLGEIETVLKRWLGLA